MSYEELSLRGLINEIKEVSSGPHTRKFCFVIGAGASRTSGIKSGQELVNLWESELIERNNDEYIKWKNELKITEENKYSFYSHYYEKRFKRNPSDGYNYLEKLMEHAKPSSGYVILAYLLSNTSHNVVITTNFDHLIEDAVNYYIQSIPLVIGHESLTHYITKKLYRPTIIKIHRDLLFDPANRVNEVESLHSNWKKALDVIFSEYHPVFIGYAGNDNSLMNYLIENSQRFANGELCCPYWMLYKNDKLDGKINKFLDESDGYYIKHDGFDKVLYLMGAVFDYKVPSKEDFFSDAEKRFQTLLDAIDEFTEKESPSKESVSNTPTDDRTEINQAVQQITDKTELQRIYRNAVLLHNSKNYNGALLEKQKLVELSPYNARYLNSLGVTLYEMKRYEEALAVTHKAAELEPENARYHDILGVTLYEMNRYEEALSEEQKAVELEPENARFHNDLGTTLHELKRYEEALAEKQRAVELEPESAIYHDNLGITLHAMERYEEALYEKQRAVELSPYSARYHDNLSATLHEMKRYEEALAEEQKAVELEPENARFHDGLSATLHEMKRYEEALNEAQKAIDLEPENAGYHNSLGITLHEMGRFGEAVIEKKKAVELDPENSEYYDSLEISQHEMERYEKEAEKDSENSDHI